MYPKPNWKTLSQLAVVLGSALALKYHYSTASVNDLRWVLAPTTSLVEWVTGRHFVFESRAGYMSDDHTFLIAASCSGVNFLIISFLMLSLGKISRVRVVGWQFVPVSFVVAYLATLVANTTRIVAALSLPNVETGWLSRDELHRVEGIVVYFGFLLLLFLVSEKMASGSQALGVYVSAIASRSKYLLMIYYGVTLGIPLLRGSYREPEFLQHLLFVLVIPVVLILPFALYRAIRNYRETSDSTRLP